MKVRVTSDSTCDLSDELIKKYNLSILPVSVILGDKVYHDGVDITPFDIFDYVKKTGKLPKTSATTIEEYKEFFTKELEEYDCIIHFTISSKASSCYSHAKAASEDFEGKVFVVDSYNLSSGQGLLVLKACDLISEGKTPKETIDIIEELKTRTNTSFVPDSLDYLHKGGRCSLASMMGAKILKLHPLIEMKDGKLFSKRRLQGRIDVCLKQYINELSKQYTSYDKTRCFVTHSNCEPEVVAPIIEQVKSLFDFDEILETKAGSTVTTHCGKNTLGLLFIYNE